MNNGIFFVSQQPWYHVPVREKGEQALEELNQKMGLAFDAWDIQYYTNLFKEKVLHPRPQCCYHYPLP